MANEEIIEINGIKYTPREKHYSKELTRVKMIMLTVGVDIDSYIERQIWGSIPRELQGIDVVKEYELIQLKESSLSKKQRNYIESKFNQYFRELS